MKTTDATVEVEVAPSKWLVVDVQNTAHSADFDGTPEDPHHVSPSEAIAQLAEPAPELSDSRSDEEETRLSFVWDRKPVKWQGVEIPITLREHGGRLFMIGFNREIPESKRFVFFRLSAEGTGFDWIEPTTFPRQIATQNMWMAANGRYFRVDDVLVDEWEVLRKLDVDSPYFDHSLTAYIWYQIETGAERYEMPRLIDQEFIREYVRKYQPIALPTIVKEVKPGFGNPGD